MGLLREKTESIFTCFVITFFLIQLCGCSTGKNTTQEAPDAKPAVAIIPLDRSYQDIVVYPFETTPVLKNDYAEAIKECQSVLISSLLMEKKYRKVEPGDDAAAYDARSVLLVKIILSDMRIASFGARFWGGAFAGNSYMNMHMKLVDASTKNVVREEYFNSANNVWAATWNFGASDRSLPSDMGKIMADYIVKAVPGR